MKLFKDLEEGEIFVVAGGFELQKCVAMLDNGNSVFTDDASISVLVAPDTETWEPEEFWEVHKDRPMDDLLDDILFTA
uniref:Uncharacterized protein n=2 Tax=unclassified bacterial viruses TaxID=12333 RepID=A0AAU8EE05_9VIRU